MKLPALRIGIDIGGTFTDFVVYSPQDGTLETFKLPSTPRDPAAAVLEGLRRACAGRPAEVIHGSTVATNALLERKGARTAFVATRGFRDVLLIGRQNRPSLYDLFASPPPPLAPTELSFEVNERVGAQGEVLQALDPADVDRLAGDLQRAGAESAAICLLFAFLRPEHEQIIARRLRQAGLFVSASSEVLPEYREYERASTTAVNAYVSPVLDKYLQRLESSLSVGDTRLRVMQSNGGNISLGEARRYGVRCILSGPAGGVVGARVVASFAGDGQGVRVITFDMGGTSTDVSLIEGEPQVTTEAVVGGCPIRVPVLDIHTIGAGGGSIAHMDAGGALRVGPESAGAEPGPACYGRGEFPTVTDANLVLGRLAPERFLGGQMKLDAGRAFRALTRLGSEMGLTAEQAALGIVAVANAHMERALRVISVARGHDPRRFTLLSFGGAGGLHAAALARRLRISQVLIPPLASTLSAFGMLVADVVKDYAQTVMLPGDTPLPVLAAHLDRLAQRGREEVLGEGVAEDDLILEPSVDMRYRGQSYELNVSFDSRVLGRFHRLHEQAYGYARPEAPVEIVTVRLRATGRVQAPPLPALANGSPDARAGWIENRKVIFGGAEAGAGLQYLDTPFLEGERLPPGCRLEGPAVIVRSDTTILLAPSDRATIDPYGNLLIDTAAHLPET